jgi:prevent-host-death family protein
MSRKVSSTEKAAKPSEIVNVAAAKARLPELIERAARGEEIVLSRAGTPRARLVPLDTSRKALRVPGKGKGRFRLARDFDEPLSPEEIASFEAGPL